MLAAWRSPLPAQPPPPARYRPAAVNYMFKQHTVVLGSKKRKHLGREVST